MKVDSMKYKLRPGILKTSICSVTVLIANREAQDYCPTIMKLPLLWSAAWECIEKQKSIDSLVQVFRILTQKNEDEIRKSIDHIFNQLYENGYLIAAEE